MQPNSKSNREVSLSIIKNNAQRVCYRCGSNHYRKKGFSKEGKQRYFCLDCRRYFLLELLCHHCGSNHYRKKDVTKEGKRRYLCLDCRRSFVENIDDEKYKPNHLELGDDVWNASELGIKVNEYTRESKLVFLYFKQNWLKDAVKKFIRYQATNKSFAQLYKYTNFLCTFSNFIEIYYPSISFKDFTREVIIDFIFFLNKQKLCVATKNQYLGVLNTFFTIGNTNSWFNVPAYLVRPEDYGKARKPLPRYIPEEVMQQLNQHLDALPEPVKRMVLVLQETGLRLGELLQLPLNCLNFDAQGDAYIQYINWKMNKEDTKPISSELAKVIQEQQQYIKQNFAESFEYLFCARCAGQHRDANHFQPKPKVMCYKAFTNFLKQLTEKFDIKDNSGKRWNFQTHQFRHTVGTRMVNLGVPLHIIQRYLGHESPQMTMTYAHIHDETLRKEVEKYHSSKVVNFQGETAELDETILSSNDDLEWFKKNVQARALEHGYCARPKVLGNCDIPGFDGCYNCPHWRTNKNFLPILKDTLERTNNVLRKAQSCGWELQVNKNTPIKDNLEKVIKTLEADND